MNRHRTHHGNDVSVTWGPATGDNSTPVELRIYTSDCVYYAVHTVKWRNIWELASKIAQEQYEFGAWSSDVTESLLRDIAGMSYDYPRNA